MEKLSEDLFNVYHSKEVSDFLLAAQSFIGFLENDKLTGEDFYKQTHLSLLNLYTKGLHLPDINLNYSDNKTDFDDAKLFQNQKQVNLSEKLSKHSIYYKIFDPIHPEKDEPTQGWLIDDYSDIYRNMKIELEKMNIGSNEAIEDALWQLKFGFEHHWGNHCIDALRALHHLKYHSYGF